MATPIALDRVTALALDPGAQLVVHGAVTTSLDGSTFDAAMQADGLAPGAMRAGGLFDLAAGGLRIVAQRADRHEYTLVATGAPGVGCAAAGIGSPCLVPRLAQLAHERLKTASELAPTLAGTVAIEGVTTAASLEGLVAASDQPIAPRMAAAATDVSLVATLFAGAWLARGWLRRRAASAIGRVKSAAREALGVTRHDPTLAGVRAQVHAMVARAEVLDASRRSFAARLAKIDRASLERRRDAAARSPSPDAAEALAWLTAECAEAERLESDLASSLLGLERIESALRVVALRARRGRGTRARVERDDPVDAAALELALREEAAVEADRAAHP